MEAEGERISLNARSHLRTEAVVRMLRPEPLHMLHSSSWCGVYAPEKEFERLVDLKAAESSNAANKQATPSRRAYTT